MKQFLTAVLAFCLLFSSALEENEPPRPFSDNNRVFYEIFVGSFSDSNGDGVGDLRGIINRMDYLNDGDPLSGGSLGVESLWLTPIFASPSYHKYDVTDYYAVDPAFGTLDDLKELLTLCHERDVKVILDLPINHTGRNNLWFKRFLNAHAMENTLSEYYDFYTWLDGNAPVPAGRTFVKALNGKIQYEANFSDSMPELNFDSPAVRQEMLNVARFYLDLGVDGFRFDAAKYIALGDNEKSAAFWRWYVGELEGIKPDLYTVAEVWDGDGIIDQYLPVMNCFDFTVSQPSGLIADTAQAGDVNRFTAYVQKYQEKLRQRPSAAQAMFISNHDMDRAAGYLPGFNGQGKMAANLYLLSPGSPFIYYGEEIGMKGSRGGANTDANRRLAMLWGDGDTVRDPAGSTYDPAKQTKDTVEKQRASRGSLFSYYQRLLRIRKLYPEIASGEYQALLLPDTKAGGFVSTLNGSAVAVIHNTTTHDLTLDLRQTAAQTFGTIAEVIGLGEAELENGVLWLEGQTSVVLK